MKRSIFNKPSWSNPQQVQNAENFFHRSNQTYVDVAAEAARKRERKLTRKQREQLQESSTIGRPAKRRRVSVDSDDDSNSSSSDEDAPPTKEADVKGGEASLDSKAGIASPVEPKASPKSLAKRYDHYIAVRKRDEAPKPPPSDIVDLEDETVEQEVQEIFENPLLAVVKAAIASEDDEFAASDEEFPELARKAREKARRKRLETDTAFEIPDAPLKIGNFGSLQRSQSIPQSTSLPPPPDPIVQIMITSQIENTEPLIIRRRVSQRLKDVRLTWCHRQEFNPELVPTVFLTWKGKRVFDVTTCKSLGITVDQYGKILIKGRMDIMEDVDGQIHMEAMTDEILEEYRKAKTRAIVDGEDEEADASKEAPPSEKKKEPQVKIILKARGFEDLKLIVRPVSKLQVEMLYVIS